MSSVLLVWFRRLSWVEYSICCRGPVPSHYGYFCWQLEFEIEIGSSERVLNIAIGGRSVHLVCWWQHDKLGTRHLRTRELHKASHPSTDPPGWILFSDSRFMSWLTYFKLSHDYNLDYTLGFYVFTVQSTAWTAEKWFFLLSLGWQHNWNRIVGKPLKLVVPTQI